MMISTRGRYALRMLIDMAVHGNGGYLPLKAVAERQEISMKYLERIVPELTKAGLLEGLHGKGGGYRLTRAPEQYPIGELLRITEGDLAPVACLAECARPCSRASECRTLPMWAEFNRITNDYFDHITLADLMK